MLAWLNRNVDLLNLLVSSGMFLIWVLYLQLFYRSYRLQRRPILLIHQASGFDLDSLCMVANLSESHVHVAAVLVDAERAGRAASFLPAPHTADPLAADDPSRQVHQGPLRQGGAFIVGRFRSLVAEADRRLEPDPGETADLRLTVRVVAFVGSQLRPAGARRTFALRERGAELEVRPADVLPEQLSARRQRDVVQDWLEEARVMDRAQVASVQDEAEDVNRLRSRLDERRARAEGADREGAIAWE